jgi:hypothetical protein
MIGSFINASLIAALLRRASTLSCFNILVVHLATADLLVFLTTAPFLVLTVQSPRHAFASVLCQGTAFFNRFTTISSMFILTVMSSSRFYSITKPFSYRIHVKPSKINVVCIFAWFLSLVLSVTPLMGWGEYEPMDGQCWCALDSAKYKYNYLTVLILAFCVPTTLNCYFLVRILTTMRARRKIKQDRLDHVRNKTNLSGNRKRDSDQKQQDNSIHLVAYKLDSGEITHTSDDRKRKDESESPNYADVESLKVSSKCVLSGLQPPVLKPQKEEDDVDSNNVSTTKAMFNVRKSFMQSINNDNQSYDVEKNYADFQKTKLTTSQVEATESNHGDAVRIAVSQNTIKAFYITLLLFLIYILCCGPTYFVWTWLSFSNSLGSAPPWALFPVFRTLAGLQSVANSVLFGIRDQQIRTEVVKLWKDIAKCAKSGFLKAFRESAKTQQTNKSPKNRFCKLIAKYQK